MDDAHSNRKPVKKRSVEPNSESRERRGSILQALPIALIVFDADLKIIEANSKATSLVKLRDRIDQSLASGTDDKIWLGWTQQLKATIAEQTTAAFDDVAYTSGSGTRLLRVVCSAAEHVGPTGGPGGIVMIEDVSDMAEIQRRLGDAERLAVIGRRASRVAHELNNPLDGILRYVNLTMRIVDQENLDKPKEYLEQCKRGLMRMVQIVGELLEFSRSTYMPSARVKIDQVIEDAIKPMEGRASNLDVRISRKYGFGLPLVRSGNLFQVFCNLAGNALDAMPDGGELTISTRGEADNSIVVEFRDTGAGLPAGDIQTIFEPFFTTKDKDKGTGLGLAICRDIIESYRGRITAENAPGGGSIFTVYLPAGG
ncbi:MAG: PAS domain-containing sensor histidine kinase [Planctomycetota bacterium]|jgi:signal transduction histidine kinase